MTPRLVVLGNRRDRCYDSQTSVAMDGSIRVMRATAGSKLSGLTATAMIGLAALELVYLVGDAELAGLLGRGNGRCWGC